MSEYTPTTEQVRELFLQDCLSSEYDESAGQFDRWLRGMMAKAFEEGAEAGAEFWSPDNPYRN